MYVLEATRAKRYRLVYTPIDKLASTESTFTRFPIPELTNYDGWAVFMDSDMIPTTDIKELFDLQMTSMQ